MKKIILIALISCVVGIGAKAQAQNINLNAKVEASKKANGAVLIHTEDGKYKVYALFKKRKVSEYYVIDMIGNKINSTYAASTGLMCTFCISVNGKTICYEVACTNIPVPKLQMAIKVN